MHKWVFSTCSVSKHINTEILSSRSNLFVNDPLNRWQNLSTVFAPSGGSRTAETGMKSGLYRFQVIMQTKWKRDFYFRLWCSAFLAIAWLLLARNRFILLTRRRHSITVLLNVDDSLCRYHSLKITGCAVAQALSVNGDTSFLYGSPRLSDFSPLGSGGQTPTNFDAKWLKRHGFTQGCAFFSKNRNFSYPLISNAPKKSKFRKFLDF